MVAHPKRFEINGRTFMYMPITPDKKPRNRDTWGRFGRSCQKLCGTSYLRPHWSCFTHCYFPRVWYGKMPPVIETTHLTVVMNKHRSWWKKILFRWLWTIAEWLYS